MGAYHTYHMCGIPRLPYDQHTNLVDSSYVPETPSEAGTDDLFYTSYPEESFPRPSKWSIKHIQGTVGEDRTTKARVLSASKAIPKYLFRMWTLREGALPHDQSPNGIVPSGNRNGKGHRSLYEMNASTFEDMVNGHVEMNVQEGSEFTSWSSSFHFVLAYATESIDTANIAVLDTEKLAGTNTVLWLHTLLGSFPEEYLVHGIIENTSENIAYASVPFKTLMKAGLSKWCPAYKNFLEPFDSPFSLPSSTIRKLGVKEVEGLKRIAATFGKPFALIITISLVCITRRSKTFWEDITDEEAKIVIKAMHVEMMPKDIEWNGSNGIINDVYDYRFEDNKQMVQLIRKMLGLWWGKGARTTKRTLEQQMEDLTVSKW